MEWLLDIFVTGFGLIITAVIVKRKLEVLKRTHLQDNKTRVIFSAILLIFFLWTIIERIDNIYDFIIGTEFFYIAYTLLHKYFLKNLEE